MIYLRKPVSIKIHLLRGDAIIMISGFFPVQKLSSFWAYQMEDI